MRIRDDFPHAIREIENAWIPTSDGARLAARIWMPVDADVNPVPAVLEYIPYRKDDWTAHQDSTRHPYFAGFGYAAVRVDIRGTGDSDGVLRGEYVRSEQDDALEVLAWLEGQPWCTGAVGMIGYSWGGFSALQVAARRPPQLKAIVTIDSTDDRYLDDCHYMGGCLLGSDMLKWASTMLAYAVQPPDPRWVGDRWREMWMRRLSEMPQLSRDWIAHQRKDAFWKHGSVAEDYTAIECPVLAVGGWADAYVNAVLRLLEHLEVPRAGIIGPWAHMMPTPGIPGPQVDFLQRCVAWWDRWLKGVDNGVENGPALLAFVQDWVTPARTYAERPGRWVAERAWPAPSASNLVMRLHEDGSLAPGIADEAPAASKPEFPEPEEVGRADRPPISPATVFVTGAQACGEQAGVWCPSGLTDELAADQGPDDERSLVFDTRPLDRPVEILGFPELRLTVTSDQLLALIAARVEDIAPTGESLLVSWGELNLTHRDSHEEPAALETGREHPLVITLRACGHRFGHGHRIRLAISPTYWPHAWPSPQPVNLGIVLNGDSTLTLPGRSDAPPFDQIDDGEIAEPLGAGDAAADRRSRSTSTDPSTGLHRTVEIAEHLREIPPTGGVLREFSEDVYSIAEDDPLSARVECRREISIDRPDWRWRIRTHSTMTCTEDAFRVTEHVAAYEDDREVFATTRSHETPRDLV
ncbi:MAG: CocE/NonD family hydrolase [Coriobacteriales bacterium]|nr:CocE/NonD family hydrolase [Coriobacteriales bacterium]